MNNKTLFFGWIVEWGGEKAGFVRRSHAVQFAKDRRNGCAFSEVKLFDNSALIYVSEESW